MRFAPYFAAIVMIAFSTQAKADWVSTDITDVVNEITGDVTKMASNLVHQIGQLKSQGQILIDEVGDLLTLLQTVQTPFQQFVDGGTGRCGQGSPCWQFRTDLQNFVLDMGALGPEFPQIANSGFGDGQLLSDLIGASPPMALFGPYRLLRRVPNWQDVPMQLEALHEAVDNADAFAGVLPAQSNAAAKALAQKSAHTSFDFPKTPTAEFCAHGNAEIMDPVRFAEIHAGLETLGSGLEVVGGFLPGDTVLVVAGEGGTVAGDPVKGIVEAIPKVITAIFHAVDFYRNSVEVCKKIESDVAQKMALFEYRTQSGAANAYWVVTGILSREQRLHPSGDYSDATTLMQNAHDYAVRGGWQSAYNAVCKAYSAID